ncbi:MAG: hypothetical protein QNJ65_19675 [Xenococcaceae cyanobacterium MO_234.B1]|nr:hypothetical protein [Xenococcaceae cyanobacterium MO_234.B1]
MNPSKPQFSADTSSIINTVSGLHSYFRDVLSYYQVIQGKLISDLEATDDEAQIQALKPKLQEVNEKINYFHVLNNSISSVDVVMHTEAMIKEFGNSESS